MKQTLFVLCLFIACGCHTNEIYIATVNQQFTLTEDKSSLIRNPAMGWGIYEELGAKRLSAETYWIQQNGAARKYASFLYIRWMWSDMEPEEGQYAWDHNAQYKKLIEGALERGLKLSFCIYYNSQDCAQQAVPNYVQQAGAKGYLSSGQEGKSYWSPYPDDPIFQQKLEHFLTAFAAQYDDADQVDFVDGSNLGWWGECHHIELNDPTQMSAVFRWVTSAYKKAFKKILLVHPFGSEFGYPLEKSVAVEQHGYALRRNGLGSQWYTTDQQQITDQMVGVTPFFGEGCWWGGNSNTSYKPFVDDALYPLKSWRDVYELTCQQALEGHFNTLDLRNPTETCGWTSDAPDLINKFIAEGGYRLYPRYFELPDRFKVADKITIRHSWCNRASGYCPNNLPNWNHKYKTAFAVINNRGEVIRTYIDQGADPSQWVGEKWFDYSLLCDVTDLPLGTYHWGVAIVDTSKENTPGIGIAVKERPEQSGWILLQKFTVSR